MLDAAAPLPKSRSKASATVCTSLILKPSGSLPAPPIGEYDLRVYLAGKLVASAPIATRDVPRVIGVVTDPLGAVANDAERISAASERFDSHPRASPGSKTCSFALSPSHAE